MCKKLILIIFYFLCTDCFVIYAQNHTEFIRSNFPGKGKAFNIAYNHYTKGLKEFEKNTLSKDYESIDLILQPAYQFNPNHKKINLILGICRFHQKKYDESYEFLSNARKLSFSNDSILYFYLGLNEHILMEYDSAIVHLQYYLSKFYGNRQIDSTASKRLEESKYGIILVRNPVRTKTDSLPHNINSLYSEYLPSFGPNDTFLIFNRLEPDPTQKLEFVNKIYISYKNQNGWDSPIILLINNIMNRNFEAVSLSSDGKQLILRSKDKNGNYDLFITKKGVKDWEPPTMLPSSINTIFDEPYAVFSESANMMYIISNRRRGFGGYDIWISNRINEFSWSNPVNIGNTINTPYNELFISVPADSSILFFSSDGHATVGYTDIFRVRNENGKWLKPVNLGYPINSSLPDTEFKIKPGGMVGIVTKEILNQSDLIIKYLPPKAKKPGLIFEEKLISPNQLIRTEIIIPKDE